MARAVKRKANIPVKSIRKYKEGYFVESNQYAWGSDIGGGGGSGDLSSSGSTFADYNTGKYSKDTSSAIQGIGHLGASALSLAEPTNGDSSAGLGAGKGALEGAAAGALFGSAVPVVGTVIGAAAGAVIGGTAGFISGGAQHRKYEQQTKQSTQANYFNTRDNMQTQNVNPYGQQMAYGDYIGLDDDGVTKGKSNKLPAVTITQGNTFPANNDPYWKLNPLVTEHTDGTLRMWGEKPTNNIATPMPNFKNPNNVLPSDKALGQSSMYYPSNSQPKLATPSAIHSNSGYYANGASIGLTGQASGRFHVLNAGLRHFSPKIGKIGKPSPFPVNNIDFNTQSQDSPQTMEDGDTVNSQQNQINIQKGELLIHPDSGKILQEYNGINPLTGGLFEPHSKDKSKESPNNFTLADPGLFVITKKTARQYKEAVDNNDKISQKTVLMNIRNAKIAKEGGLQPQGGIQQDQLEQGNYAYGDTVDPSSYQNILNYGQYANQLGIPGGQLTAAHTNSNPSLAGYNTPQIDTTNVAQKSTYIPQGHQSDFGRVGDTLSNYGPALYNIGQGLFGSVQHQAHANPISNPYANNVIANMPKNVDMSPIISDINSNEALANKNLQNQSNSSAVYRANREGLSVATARSLAGARMQAAEVNNQAAGQRAYMYNALGYQNQQEQEQRRQYDLGVDQINARSQSAKQNLLNAGLSQLQQTSQNEKTNKQKAGMDRYTLDLLAQTFPNTRFYNQFQIDYVKKIKGEQ